MLAGPSWAADDGLVWISKLAFQSPCSVEVVREAYPPEFPHSAKGIDEAEELFPVVVVQHAGIGAAVSGASSGCQLSSEQLTVTCLAPLPLKLQLLVSLAAMVGTWWCFLPASVSTNYHFESLRPSTQGHVSSFHIVTGFSQLIFLIVNICQNVPKMAYY